MVTTIWRSITLVSLVALGFWAGRVTSRVEGLESWRASIEILAAARDERLKTLERESSAAVRWREEVIRRLDRIEQSLSPPQPITHGKP